MPGGIAQYFTGLDYLLALPMLLLTLFAMGILLIDLMLPPEWKWSNALTAFVGVCFATAGVWRIHSWYNAQGRIMGHAAFMNTLIVDRFALYFFYLFLAGTAVAILMSARYLEIEKENHGEYYALMLFSVVGMMCMAAGFDIVMIFIGLELMAISTYVLVGFLRRDKRSNEAALKYMLLGAFSSGIFAYGLSLFYGLTGSTNIQIITQRLAQRVEANGHHADAILIVAMLTTATGLLFKVAAVPFHQWAPDAYEGAPTSITGFMSVSVKAAGWAMLIRLFMMMFPLRPAYVPFLVFVSIATMTGANFAAVHVRALVDGHGEMPLAEQRAATCLACRDCRGHTVLVEAGTGAHFVGGDEINYQHAHRTVALRLQNKPAIDLQRRAQHHREHQRFAQELGDRLRIGVP